MPNDAALTDVITYGPGVGTEDDFGLVGDVRGRRVLEVGCGRGQRAVAFARRGATTIGIDVSSELVEAALDLCERQGVRVELRHGDLADLAFLRGDSVDVVFSAYSLGYVANLERVFRQTHRVLKPGGPLVFSLPHPAWRLVDSAQPDQPPLVVRSYFDRSPQPHEREGIAATLHQHTISDLVAGLVRSGYRIDTVLEPDTEGWGASARPSNEVHPLVPRTLIVRARKEGN